MPRVGNEEGSKIVVSAFIYYKIFSHRKKESQMAIKVTLPYIIDVIGNSVKVKYRYVAISCTQAENSVMYVFKLCILFHSLYISSKLVEILYVR